MNATPLFLAGALAIGALIPVQVALNAQLGGITKNALSAGLIVFLVGTAAFLLAVAVSRPQIPSLSTFASAPQTMWFGGLIAAIYVLATVLITPKLGVGLTTVLIVTGQLFMALALDHYGAFGNPEQSLNLWRIGGALAIIAGVVAIKTH